MIKLQIICRRVLVVGSVLIIFLHETIPQTVLTPLIFHQCGQAASGNCEH